MRVPRTVTLACAGCLLLAAVGAGVGIGLARGHDSAVPRHAAPRSRVGTGWPFDRRVPSLALVDDHGRPTSLATLRGKAVVLAPSLTLCHEVCPMTTGAFMRMRRTVAAVGLSGRVAFVEVTVDPWRDSPARLRAYARLTGARFALLTGSAAQIRRFWRFFGIGYRRVRQGHPPDTDWWTHKPEAYDVEHVDGVFLIDPRGHERAFFSGMAGVGGHLGPRLGSLLSDDGRRNLAHPRDAWTGPRVLAAVGRLLGRAPRRSGRR